MTELRLAVAGADADLESLWSWLADEPGLRGSLRLQPEPVAGGTMGLDQALGVAVPAAAVASIVGVLARSLSAYLIERERQRRSNVTVTVSGPAGGPVVKVTAQRVPDVEKLLQHVLSAQQSPTEPGGSR